MNFGHIALTTGVLAGTALIGGAKGYRRAQTVEANVNQTISEDIDDLNRNRRLRPRHRPHQPTGRSPHPIWSCYLLGILGTGFAFWLICAIALTIFAHSTGQSIGAAIITAFIFSVFAGVLGLLAGIGVGSSLWMREVKARLREMERACYYSLWSQREALRADLDQGKCLPDDAVATMRKWLISGINPIESRETDGVSEQFKYDPYADYQDAKPYTS